MLSSFPVPDSFFLGAKVCRKFGKKWFIGTVDDTSADEGESIWRITYSDFDSEEVDRQGLAAILAYHPLLEADGDLPIPEVDTFVWFSVDQSPRLGKVVEVDPSSVRPITVHLYTPRKGAADITRAKFVAVSEGEDNQPVVKRLTLPQVILRVPRLTPKGYLTAKDRSLLAKRLYV